MKKIDAVIFDMDGVITKTALVHGRAWKQCFDDYLRLRETRDHEPFKEFTHDKDYLPFVDGKPRYEGVKSFLGSRHIHISFGDPADEPTQETVCGLGNQKNKLFVDILQNEGAQVYPSTISLIKALKARGVRIGVASSSKNCELILEKSGVKELFESRVDGVVSAKLGLKGKPEGDIFVKAARDLGAEPSQCVVVEDAVSGVEAGRNGGFGLVLGVARENNEQALLTHGADLVVTDLEHISVACMEQWFERQPSFLFENWDKTSQDCTSKVSCCEKCAETVQVNPSYGRSPKDIFVSSREPVFFLDYDGTLTPIVDRPDLATVSQEMRKTVELLAKKYRVAIVSGRQRENVEKMLGIKDIFYAGSHGLDIAGPGFRMVEPRAEQAVSSASQLIDVFKKTLGDIPGIIIEEKTFSTAVHYRMVDEQQYLERITTTIKEQAQKHSLMKVMNGKKVFEILPDIDWDKGKAIRWIMNALKMSWEQVSVVYIGDDVTDEYAFRAIRTRGTGILVSDEQRASSADFQISSPDEVKKLFNKILNHG